MDTTKIERYIQAGKLYISTFITAHPLIFFSFIIPSTGLLISTSVFLIYPEVVSDNISTNQFFLIYLFHTSILALIYITPGLICLGIDSTRDTTINQLYKTKFQLALAEFYLPNVYLASLFGFFLFDFGAVYELVIIAFFIVIGLVIALLYYRYSWPHRSVDFRKLKANNKTDYLVSYVFMPLLCGVCSLLLMFA